MSETRFAERRVIVTGGASGIGRATALRLAREGARVLIVDRNESLLQTAADEIAASTGADIETFLADVTVKAQVEAAVARSVDLWGGVDVLINNAGIAHQADFLEISESQWDEVLDVNLKGIFLFGQAVARQMASSGGGGVIVNTSSTNGLVGEARLADYNASKGGVTLLTKSMAIDLAPHGIRVNCVCPGYISTPLSATDDEAMVRRYIENFIPIGRRGQPEDVAAAFAFLASDDASFITGESLVVDGGQLTF